MKPGYKQTEVGAIPEDWDMGRLGDLVDPDRTIRYGIVQPGKYDPNGRYMIRGQDYSRGWVDPSELFRVTPAIEEPFANARVRTDDVLITIVGASTGRIAVVPIWLDGANLTQTTARIALRSDLVDRIYCSYILASPIGAKQVSNYLKGAAQPGLNCGDIEKFLIPLPTLSEQRAISAALSDMDALLDGLDRLIAKKYDLKQAAMQQLLTGQTRLPGFKGRWTPAPLSQEVEQLEAGVSVNSVDDASTTHTDGKSILKTSSVAAGRFMPHEAKKIAQRDIARARVSPHADSIIISRMNTPELVGECGYVPSDFPDLFLPDRLWITRIHPESDVCVRWLCYLLASNPYRVRIKGMATGTSGSMKNIGKDTLLALQISYPDSAEQIAIAAVLSDMDAELTELEAQREKTKNIKHAMMQELLTGNTRLV